MTDRPRGSIFSPAFLDRLQEEDGDGSADATAEADWAGPWVIEPLGECWAVTTEGEEEPYLVAASYDTALLAAALLPGTGRTRLVQIREQPDAEGFPLLGTAGEVLAHVRHFVPDLATALHVVECLRRAPLDLARFLHSTRGSALVRAGRILWTWDQAPPRQD